MNYFFSALMSISMRFLAKHLVLSIRNVILQIDMVSIAPFSFKYKRESVFVIHYAPNHMMSDFRYLSHLSVFAHLNQKALSDGSFREIKLNIVQ